MSDFIKRGPCASCSDLRRDMETGYRYCAADPSGDRTCEAAVVTERVAEVADQLAVIIRAHVRDAEERVDLAIDASAYFARLLSLNGADAVFDEDALVEACEVRHQAVA